LFSIIELFWNAMFVFNKKRLIDNLSLIILMI